MRQEGVRVASGRRQDNLASGWRQDDVKRRGARINLPLLYRWAGRVSGAAAYHFFHALLNKGADHTNK